MIKLERKGSEKPLHKQERKYVLDFMKGEKVEKIAADRDVQVRAVVERMGQPEAVKVINARELKKSAELAEIVDILSDIIRKEPQTKLKYSELLKAMELKLSLDGHLNKPKEEKHLHIHGAELGLLSEGDLRRELKKLQDGRSSNPMDGVPHTQGEPIDAEFKA